jgi:hypothetical protein
MKAANLALVALAGFGLVTSQLAYADTLPGSALPTLSHAHPAKIARLTEKRHGQAGANDSALVGALPIGAIIIGAVALGGIIYAIVEVSKGDYVLVSTGA